MASMLAGYGKALAGVCRTVGRGLISTGYALQGVATKETFCGHRAVVSFKGATPSLGANTFVAPSAAVIGRVTVGSGSSVWNGAVVRGDVNEIKIGNNSAIQEGAVVHVTTPSGSSAGYSTSIGNNVVVGNNSIVHAATLGNFVTVGANAQVLDGAIVEDMSCIAPGAVVTPNTKIASGELWAGNPAKKLRVLSDSEKEALKSASAEIQALGASYNNEYSKPWQQVELEKEAREARQERSADYDSHIGIGEKSRDYLDNPIKYHA
uniref:Gamma carbonic anhydrase n=1 Tax=Palpitomonas bilix TaxID=652834 RepID=A0A7S3D3U5_9EUKA|mmetsp:Transcript_20610/g.52982  ORF Transcript_20610/g.52982 Transcript_20610/m.52982 type:complete len:265 (+) Transcript_20610:153-947(+)|eukprot:CAMPEP_0113873960 /NCGR_PEP_ID=MMETSP0780_2-20120614/4064_1 /TAXON_ID=652834 /ORGANISM="Palpitomonas bilix" /LENGTH=264 /DNA_ID=CAMNT_0000859671 /DNA_START=109 /DNA_END=903 /DNA_ORIENTATION=- /assembly_acc=CAM_ASM_000599